MHDQSALTEEAARELELKAFIDNLQGDPPELLARKVRLHSRWYTDEDFCSILDAAREVDARMTFCFLGRDVRYRGDIIRRMVAEGHEVATHAMRHVTIDSELSYQQLHRDLTLCSEELRGMGVTVAGLWISTDGVLSRDAGQAVVDAGLRWFAAGESHAPAEVAPGLRFVPILRPTDFEQLVVRQMSPDLAGEQWRELGRRRSEAVFLFHPFTMADADPRRHAAWTSFLREVEGAVPVSEWPDRRGRVGMLVDASLRLHLI